jgi:hypothetical protein
VGKGGGVLKGCHSNSREGGCHPNKRPDSLGDKGTPPISKCHTATSTAPLRSPPWRRGVHCR